MPPQSGMQHIADANLVYLPTGGALVKGVYWLVLVAHRPFKILRLTFFIVAALLVLI